jgi:hypothetical protein
MAEKNYYHTLERMFQEHMDELQEDESDANHHAWMCGVAAERTIEDISSHVNAIAEKRKWGHIEAVNRDFFGG